MSERVFTIPDFGGGRKSGYSPLAIPTNAFADASNLHYDEWPAASVRPGTATLNGTAIAAAAVRGLVTAEFSGGTKKHVGACSTKLVTITSGGVLADLKTGLTASDWTFCMYDDQLLCFSADNAAQTYNGTAISGLGGTPPQAAYCVQAYERVFATGAAAAPSTLYWCARAAENDWTTADNAGSLTVETNDGDKATWLSLVAGQPTLWKARSIHAVVGRSPLTFQVERVPSKVGCPAGKTVAGVGNVTHFLSYAGVYAWDGYSEPILVSGDVQDVVESINWDQVTKFAGFGWGGKYFCAVATGANTEPDTILVRYLDLPGKPWLAWEGLTPRIFALLRVAGYEWPYMGDATGKVWKFATGTADGSTAIAWDGTTGALLADGDYKVFDTFTPTLRVEASGTASLAYALTQDGAVGTAKSVALTTPNKALYAPFDTAGTESRRGKLLRVKFSGAAAPATLERCDIGYRRLSSRE